ncbi:phosphatidate cytidylyltransferase [Paraferrimonas sp. SM1919]|uniref:phosphatidate cytidylyltransferase n=1 Tax=Paraferrimonas sp. SM1919 TaxID=2662263 RepID=UPI0013D46313|nr:phosphatidate cytidylyltransferase [Paraferrimonas sp. SM1919]
MLKQRIMTALVLLPAFMALIFLAPQWLFVATLFAIFCLAAKEWGNLIQPGCTATQISFVITLALLMIATLYLVPLQQFWYSDQLNITLQAILMLAGLWWLVAIVMVITYPKGTDYWKDSHFSKSLFGQLTLFPAFIAFVILHSVPNNQSDYFGGWLILAPLLMVWLADTGAYFVGKAMGKTKLMPKVSPGKTIEGFAGGLLFAVVGASVYGHYVLDVEWPVMILIAVVTTVISAFGDLLESLFKRNAGIKDSGNILPGHGGVLDRIDSMTAAIPVFALLYIVLGA